MNAAAFHPQQMTLNLCLPDHATFTNFYTGKNQNVVTILHSIATNPLTKFTYLWGEHGCGRTHLLLACCAYYHEQNVATTYIPLKELKGSSPKILENLENMALLCFDDLDVVAGLPHWEEAIFHCFNRLQQQQCNIIVTASATPHAIPFCLQDLKSRMTSGMIYEIKALNDDEKIAALQFRARQLGLTLSHQTASFMINHCARDTTSLFKLLRQLDKKALQTQRRLTVPFIKTLLQGESQKNRNNEV